MQEKKYYLMMRIYKKRHFDVDFFPVNPVHILRRIIY